MLFILGFVACWLCIGCVVLCMDLMRPNSFKSLLSIYGLLAPFILIAGVILWPRVMQDIINDVTP